MLTLNILNRTISSKILKIPNFISNCSHVRQAHRKSIYKREEAKKFRFFVIHKYVEYLKNYDKWIKTKFPSAQQIYRVFMDGVKYFLIDTKSYFGIVRILFNTPHGFSKLNRRELELYHQMPKDMRKIAPVLILSALPIVFYGVLPLAYLFPRHLLTSHFWNLQQKNDFKRIMLRNRLLHNKPVFRHLQLQLDKLDCEPEIQQKWSEVLGKLGSGVQPTVEEVVECQILFSEGPYHLYYLSYNHISHLIKMHDMHSGWFRRVRLAERAKILKEMDKAILREGGVHNLPLDALKNACYIRGLNPTNMKNEDMITWLRNWIKISKEIDNNSLSLLLHTPVLIGYNEPSNWILIYPNK